MDTTSSPPIARPLIADCTAEKKREKVEMCAAPLIDLINKHLKIIRAPLLHAVTGLVVLNAHSVIYEGTLLHDGGSTSVDN